jgi:polar amino acid transport system permease protein
MDFNPKLFFRFFPQLLEGYFFTLQYAFIGIVFSILLGILIGMVMCLKIPVVNTILRWYIDIFRETPLIVQMYLLYYGLPYVGVLLPPAVAGMLAIIFNESAFTAEIVRGGIESIGLGQKKAARSLGFSRIQILLTILLPQAMKSIYPSLAGQGSFILKDTSLLTLVTITELTSVSRYLNSRYLIPGTAFIGSAIFYVVTFWAIQGVVSILQKRQKWN